MRSLAVSLGILLVSLCAPAQADNYPGVGRLMFEPKHLLPYSEATQDPHCEDTAEQLCRVVHKGGEDETYREELLRRYCLSDQYKKCVFARSVMTPG